MKCHVSRRYLRVPAVKTSSESLWRLDGKFSVTGTVTSFGIPKNRPNVTTSSLSVWRRGIVGASQTSLRDPDVSGVITDVSTSPRRLTIASLNAATSSRRP